MSRTSEQIIKLLKEEFCGKGKSMGCVLLRHILRLLTKLVTIWSICNWKLTV